MNMCLLMWSMMWSPLPVNLYFYHSQERPLLRHQVIGPFLISFIVTDTQEQATYMAQGYWSVVSNRLEQTNVDSPMPTGPHGHPRCVQTHASLSHICQCVPQLQCCSYICMWLSHHGCWGLSTCSKPHLQLILTQWQIFQQSGQTGMLYFVWDLITTHTVGSHTLGYAVFAVEVRSTAVQWAPKCSMLLVLQCRLLATFTYNCQTTPIHSHWQLLWVITRELWCCIADWKYL